MSTDRRSPSVPSPCAPDAAPAPSAAAAPGGSRPVAPLRSLVSQPEYFTRGVEVTEVGDTQAAELLDLFGPSAGR